MYIQITMCALSALRVILPLLLVGCGASPEGPGAPGEGTSSEGELDDTSVSAQAAGDVADEATEDGCQAWETRSCSIDLGVRDGVRQCAEGTELCEGGRWSECLTNEQLAAR